MTARPVDAAVVQAFLEAVSPVGVEVAVRVLDQVEQQIQDLRRQWELQLEQSRYEARLAQRKYDTVDPDNRLVAAELERRWNAQLTRVAELEQAYAKAEQEANFTLTPEERAAMQTLAQDLAAIWQAETTTHAERKQLLRLAMESVQIDGVSRPGWIEVQICWRSVLSRSTSALPSVAVRGCDLILSLGTGDHPRGDFPLGSSHLRLLREAELASDAQVYRYQPGETADDGVGSPEGTFNACSFWLAESLARAGRIDAARLLLEKMLTYSNHVGLYAEEMGPTGQALGNSPRRLPISH